jgi:hypothetical protein
MGIAILVVVLGIFITNSKETEPVKETEKVTDTGDLAQEETQKQVEKEEPQEQEIQKESQEQEIPSVQENELVVEDKKEETTDLPESSTVVIEPESAEEDGELQFPFEIKGYDMEIVGLGAYTGVFVEDGSNEQVSGVAMLQVKNTGTAVIEYAELQVEVFLEILNFKIAALPAGESAVLLEQQRKMMPEEAPQKCVATVVQRESMGMSKEKISVTDAGDNRLLIKNLTDQKQSNIRVFYKYYMADKEVFWGGIAFSLKVPELEAGKELMIQPAHYQSGACQIVMVSTD